MPAPRQQGGEEALVLGCVVLVEDAADALPVVHDPARMRAVVGWQVAHGVGEAGEVAPQAAVHEQEVGRRGRRAVGVKQCGCHAQHFAISR